MTDFRTIYNSMAAEYDYLVMHEDYQGNILNALVEIRPLAGLDVFELGAGTGRLTRLLAPQVDHIYFSDISGHMLAQAKQNMARSELTHWDMAVVDNRHLAIKSHAVDIAIAGWSLGHFTGWYPDDWQQQIGRALMEMKRVLRPGGTIIILETLGTGQKTPRPPTPELQAYFHWLVQEHQFLSRWIRTDYQFPSYDEAKASISFFFGADLAERIVPPDSDIVPECTGVWWLTT